MASTVNTRRDATRTGPGPVREHRAAGRERHDALRSGFYPSLLGAARIGEHDRVLDVGCGTGEVTRRAARLAARGAALGLDPSEAMLDQAREAAFEENVANVTFERGHTQVHPFDATSFDVAVSRGVVAFPDDHVAAFTDIARALRPGGRLAVLVPRPGDPRGDHATVFAALDALLGGRAARRPPLSDPDRLREVLTRAGFARPALTPVEAPVIWGRDADEATDVAFSGGLGDLDGFDGFDGFEPAGLERARDAVREGFRAFEAGGAVRLRATVWIATAVRP